MEYKHFPQFCFTSSNMVVSLVHYGVVKTFMPKQHTISTRNCFYFYNKKKIRELYGRGRKVKKLKGSYCALQIILPLMVFCELCFLGRIGHKNTYTYQSLFFCGYRCALNLNVGVRKLIRLNVFRIMHEYKHLCQQRGYKDVQRSSC